MIAEVSLRDATDADAPVILALMRAANEEYLGIPGYVSGAHGDTVAGMRAVMADVSVVLAIADERIVGCVFFAWERDHCFLFRLGVLPAWRRRGIGRALVEEVEHRARARGAPCIRLGVRRNFTWNHAYYEQLGYCILLDQTTETDLIMEKQL
jgi:ribosomal protein S18 acetylase RimI-like enzyme